MSTRRIALSRRSANEEALAGLEEPRYERIARGLFVAASLGASGRISDPGLLCLTYSASFAQPGPYSAIDCPGRLRS
jgi:hypothetical protein